MIHLNCNPRILLLEIRAKYNNHSTLEYVSSDLETGDIYFTINSLNLHSLQAASISTPATTVKWAKWKVNEAPSACVHQ